MDILNADDIQLLKEVLVSAEHEFDKAARDTKRTARALDAEKNPANAPQKQALLAEAARCGNKRTALHNLLIKVYELVPATRA